MRLNCIAVDGTLTVGSTSSTELAFRCLVTNKNLLPVLSSFKYNPKVFINNFINDNGQGDLGKTIKASILRGDKVALTTMNKSAEYCLLVMSLIGLSKDEISQIYIRSRKSGDSKTSKIKHIKDVHKLIFNSDDIECSDTIISLIDDNMEVCLDAGDYGLKKIIHVDIEYDAELKYIEKYRKLLDLNIEDIELVPLKERMNTYLSLTALESKVVSPPKLQLIVEVAEVLNCTSEKRFKPSPLKYSATSAQILEGYELRKTPPRYSQEILMPKPILKRSNALYDLSMILEDDKEIET